MTVDRTKLEWKYEPTDFFEAPYRHAEAAFDLVIKTGSETATTTVAMDPVPRDLEDRVRSSIENIFFVRKIQTRRKYNLEGPAIYQYSSGRRNVSVRLKGVSINLMAGNVDFTLRDAAGNIIRDSKAERIAEDTSLLDFLAPKLQQSPTLRAVVSSYLRSVDDPDDEFTHLYEIRDALCKHYGNEDAARRALGVSRNNFSRFRALANVEPVEQGRHRGKHPHGRRPATPEELEEARKLAREWILAFAQTV
jgi:hypothetical protein